MLNLLLALGCLVAGCKGTSRDDRKSLSREGSMKPIPISENQATAIADAAARRKGWSPFELGHPVLSTGDCWRVVVESKSPGSNCRYTNDFFMDVNTRSDAEMVAKAMASVKCGETNLAIRSIQSVHNCYWSVVVWPIPGVPDGQTTIYISAKDGKLIDPFFGNPHPHERSKGSNSRKAYFW
jgi:hypothetical protein